MYKLVSYVITVMVKFCVSFAVRTESFNSIHTSFIRNSKFRCMSEATPPYHLMSSLSYYSYQKDERAQPGNLLTKLCSFSPLGPSENKVSLSLHPLISSLNLPFIYPSHLSLSLSLLLRANAPSRYTFFQHDAGKFMAALGSTLCHRWRRSL
jgi:hypothetical protein